MSTTETKSLNDAPNTLRLPRNRYGIRCIEANFAISKTKKTPYIEMTWEICTPESMDFGAKNGGEQRIAGRQARRNFWITDKSLKFLNEFHALMGMEKPEINVEDVDYMKEYVTRYIGLGAQAELLSKQIVKTYEKYNDEGEIETVEVLDDAGNPIVTFALEVGNFFKADPTITVRV